MKKNFAFIFLLLVMGISTAHAQRAIKDNITRNLVVVELKSNMAWPNCPRAVLGSHELIVNGDPVAVIDNHIDDIYTNEYSNARNNFYPASLIPTTYFDGILSMVGGQGDMYPPYHNYVNERMNITTPFDIDFSFINNGNNNYTATVNISKVGTYDENVILYMFITESHIPESWGEMDEINYVNRLMVPDTNGTALDFSAGNDIVEELNFDLPDGLNRDNCEIVVAIQNIATTEIFNGAKASMLRADHENDVILNKVIFPGEVACNGAIYPIIEIKNYGSEHLTSLDIEYYINDDNTAAFPWVGDLSFPQTEIVYLPAIAYQAIEGENNLTITITNPNGQVDGNPTNNSVTTNFTTGIETTKNISMELYVGYVFSNQVSWKLIDCNGEVVEEGGDYGGGTTVEKTWALHGNNCYTFFLMDSGENGYSGYCKLSDDNGEFVNITDELVDVVEVTFHTDSNVGLEELSTSTVSIYPNPSQNTTNISYSLTETASVSVDVYSITGAQVLEISAVKQTIGNQKTTINTSSLEEGIYFVSLTINDQVITKKITVIK